MRQIPGHARARHASFGPRAKEQVGLSSQRTASYRVWSSQGSSRRRILFSIGADYPARYLRHRASPFFYPLLFFILGAGFVAFVLLIQLLGFGK